MEIREQDLLQNIHSSLKWKLGCSNLGIKLKQIFRVLAGSAPAPLKWQLKEACFSPDGAGSHSACLQPYLAPAGLEWCRPSSQSGCAKSLTSPRLRPLPPHPMTASPDIDGQGTGLK